MSLSMLVLALLAACATTQHDREGDVKTWRTPTISAEGPDAPAEPLPVYVVAFGLAPSVARRWPELEEARAGFGIAQRTADALYDSGLFALREEKPEVVARLRELIERRASGAEGEAAVPDIRTEAPWLLYGELVEVREARDERVAGFSGRTERRVEVVVQLRLVKRSSGRVLPATGSGGATVAAGVEDALEPGAVADATAEAVARAAERLVRSLGGAR